jgi:hypothetical protein
VLQRLQTLSPAPPSSQPARLFTGATTASVASDRDLASAFASGRMEFDPDLDNPAYLAACVALPLPSPPLSALSAPSSATQRCNKLRIVT